MTTFVHRTRLPAPAGEVFRWLNRPGVLERLTPPWEKVQVLSREGGVREGGRVTLMTRTGPLRQHWVIEHRDHAEGQRFCDVQIEGPFAKWICCHIVEPDGEQACVVEDRIEYELPWAGLGKLAADGMIRKRLERIFAYRAEVLAADLAAQGQFLHKGKLRILISGSTGMLGTALIPFLTTGGHEVVRLVRRPMSGGATVLWNPAKGELRAGELEGFDAFIHLSGEYIADGHWNKAKRERVWSSRVDTTRLLVRAISQLKSPPKVLVCASGTGFYGEGGAHDLDEDSPVGESCFFVDMVKAWEAAAQEASAYGVRVVNCRIGVVLSPVGGALKSMLPAFRWGGGAVLGSGSEATGWLTLDDLVGMIHFAMMCDGLRGAVNFAAPQWVTQRELSTAIGRVLHRPVWVHIPDAAVRWIFSPELAEAMGWSQRIVPRRLTEAGYRFRYPELDRGLRHVLGIRGDMGGAA